jgi:hypothetical protein
MKPILRKLCAATLATLVPFLASAEQWTPEKAQNWAAGQPWRVGSNFAPSTAINQLEMWQAETFDLETIDRELGWAASIGMNSARVFLHHLLWEQDPEGFLERINQFLAVADQHGIGVMLVLFDDVWDPHPQLGVQRPPRPHVHNSGWVQSPGRAVLLDTARRAALEPYVKGVIDRFKDDPRVIVWDLYNEPGNPNRSAYGNWEIEDKARYSLDLLKRSFAWAWQVRPSQPITAGVWTGDWSSPEKRDELNRYMLDNSDVITFHAYGDLEKTRAMAEPLFAYKRPVLCTEFMARPAGSRLEEILPYFKEKQIGAYQWGLVQGKTQTNYPWDSWKQPYDAEPDEWFHELFRTDGTPYIQAEVELYKSLTAR